jgi:hypothetical protein
MDRLTAKKFEINQDKNIARLSEKIISILRYMQG